MVQTLWSKLGERAVAAQLLMLSLCATVVGVFALVAILEIAGGSESREEIAHNQYVAGALAASANNALAQLRQTGFDERDEPPVLDGASAILINDQLRATAEFARQLKSASPESGDLGPATRNALDAFQAYLAAPGTATGQLLIDAVETVLAQTSPVQIALERDLESRQGRLEFLSRAGVAGVIATVSGAALLMAVMIWVTGRRLRHALDSANAEKAALVRATGRMEHRNGQFQALYQVMSEVSETLSLRYVVQTTVREARKLVDADVVEVRLLRENHLEVAGTGHAEDDDIAGLRPLELGAGLTGRVAKRGRSMRLDQASAAEMVPEEFIAGVESGLILPLIVGARVVGTLSCWSRQANLFTEDDEQVLGMMASQVATAVVAASTHEASEHEAHHDALTGLPNRRQLMRDFEDRFRQRVAGGNSIAFAMIDIDHFKHFNDEYGHKVGDITLQKVAETLRTVVRGADMVYRFGGEEFTIVMDQASADDALSVIERARAAVARMPLIGEALQPVGPVTISAGIAVAPMHGSDVEQLLKLADDALYQSKWTGRNRVTLYDAAPEVDAAA